jgi:uncharacterized membrane protein YkvA (DUF1232 family)
MSILTRVFLSPVRLWRGIKRYSTVFTHKDTPWYIKGLTVAVALYLISPYDLIPDWILGPGFIDDIAVVSLLTRLWCSSGAKETGKKMKQDQDEH